MTLPDTGDLHGEKPGVCLLVYRRADRTKARIRALQLRLGLGEIALRLLALLDRDGGHPLQDHQPVEGLLRELERGAGLFLIGDGLREIARNR